jgi:putative tributyrin esterase
MALVSMNFQSRFLGGNTDVDLILPDLPWTKEPEKFYSGRKKYPVLWLLHGTFGDYSDWIRKSKIELYAAERDLVVVMPSALNTNYEDWPNFGLGHYTWQYFFRELMPMVYAWYPVSRKREDNYVAGLSMGGGGAMKFAIAHPEKFAGAAMLSYCPVKLAGRKTASPDMSRRTANEIAVFGGKKNYLASHENTWDNIRSLAGDPDCPKLYFACGDQDEFFQQSFPQFQKYAESIGLKARFDWEPGYRHEWRFWDLTIERALDYFAIPKRGPGK